MVGGYRTAIAASTGQYQPVSREISLGRSGTSVDMEAVLRGGRTGRGSREDPSRSGGSSVGSERQGVIRMKSLFAAASIAGLALAATSASAQDRMLQMDVNNLGFQARNSLGAPAPFGGLSHTGSMVLQETLPTSTLNDIAIQTGGPGNPFVPQAFTGTLGDVMITINLSNGNVTGGSMMLHVGSDMYSANIAPGGSVTTFVGGGFKIDSLTSTGMFTGNTFAGVNIADFFAGQAGSGLPGSFLNFRIIPDGNGAGLSDIDIFVSVPSPGSLALLGMGAAVAVRRRRR